MSEGKTSPLRKLKDAPDWVRRRFERFRDEAPSLTPIIKESTVVKAAGEPRPLILMRPGEFHALAYPFDKSAGRADHLRVLKADIDRDGGIVDLPFLTYGFDLDGRLGVYGHQGRHRTKLLIDEYGAEHTPSKFYADAYDTDPDSTTELEDVLWYRNPLDRPEWGSERALEMLNRQLEQVDGHKKIDSQKKTVTGKGRTLNFDSRRVFAEGGKVASPKTRTERGLAWLSRQIDEAYDDEGLLQAKDHKRGAAEAKRVKLLLRALAAQVAGVDGQGRLAMGERPGLIPNTIGMLSMGENESANREDRDNKITAGPGGEALREYGQIYDRAGEVMGVGQPEGLVDNLFDAGGTMFGQLPVPAAPVRRAGSALAEAVPYLARNLPVNKAVSGIGRGLGMVGEFFTPTVTPSAANYGVGTAIGGGLQSLDTPEETPDSRLTDMAIKYAGGGKVEALRKLLGMGPRPRVTAEQLDDDSAMVYNARTGTYKVYDARNRYIGDADVDTRMAELRARGMHRGARPMRKADGGKVGGLKKAVGYIGRSARKLANNPSEEARDKLAEKDSDLAMLRAKYGEKAVDAALDDFMRRTGGYAEGGQVGAGEQVNLEDAGVEAFEQIAKTLAALPKSPQADDLQRRYTILLQAIEDDSVDAQAAQAELQAILMELQALDGE